LCDAGNAGVAVFVTTDLLPDGQEHRISFQFGLLGSCTAVVK
jgi:hypothetical protein